ncbi:PREDICTED: mavicyanin-like [Prunus mume]|uniref:Mavicyanin-like n=1 Tax=Prunus mume TaxID=102107 RepID=A0ABM1LLH8_PRUMU|nr:PREDICTED: mavicyanin-like [Prunus mume]
MALYGVCFGAVYRVGDSNGWTSRGHVDYNEWASTKDFHVNDTLIFTFTLNRPGHFYFICGTPGHCQAGQNVDINVTLPISTDGSFASPSPAP